MAADVAQLALAPFTAEGAFSIVDDGIDFAAAAVLILLLGWHLAFLPSFIVKALPLADLAPTWTVAVWIATRGRDPDAPTPSPLPGVDVHDWRLWYDALIKPRWTPAPRTIGRIWAILYPLLLGVCALVFVQCYRGRLPAIAAWPFVVNLVTNFAFTPILFRWKNLPLATLDVLAVLATAVWGMVLLWPTYPLVALALLPYAGWVAVASSLQILIFLYNRGEE